jgi:hypothetical protein
MVLPTTAAPSPWAPSGRMVAATPLRTASEQRSPYDPLTGALVTDSVQPDTGIVPRATAEAVALPDISGLADYQALTSGRERPVDQGLADYQRLTSGAAVESSDPALTSYLDIMTGRGGGVDTATETSTMTPQSYADLTAGRRAQQMPERMDWQDEASTMTPQSYADLTAGKRAQQMPERMDWQDEAPAAAPVSPYGPTGAMEVPPPRGLGVPEAAPPTGLQEALQRQYMSRVGGAEDPILASQLADLEERQRQQEQSTIEQLSRYGVLRGGGDTANVLAQMREGQSRNRLALEAASAQRQQQELRDALGFEQATSQMGLAGRGMGLQERLGAQDVMGRQLGRQLQRAGVTGQFEGADTMAGRELEDRLATAATQRGAIGGGERRADIAQEAGLFGEITGAGSAPARATMAGLGAREQRAMSRAQRGAIGGAETRADVAQEAGLFGEIAGEGSARARQTMARRSLDEQLAASRAQRGLAQAADVRQQVAQEAGLFGEVSGAGSAPARRTMAGKAAVLQRAALGGAETRAQQAQEAALFGQVAGEGEPIQTLGGRQFDLQEQLAQAADVRQQQQLESGLFGQVATGVSPLEGPIRTLGGQQVSEALAGQRLAREATEAGLTGQFRGDQTAQERALRSQLETGDIQRRLAEAGVTGEFDFGDQRGRADTLQAQALGSEMQGAALQRALQRAGATGEFLEEGGVPGEAVETLESRLRTAGLTGALAQPTGVEGDPTKTLAGQQAEMDRIGAILAAIDPSMKGRGDPLAEALGATLGEPPPPLPDWASSVAEAPPAGLSPRDLEITIGNDWQAANPQREGEGDQDYLNRKTRAMVALATELGDRGRYGGGPLTVEEALTQMREKGQRTREPSPAPGKTTNVFGTTR